MSGKKIAVIGCGKLGLPLCELLQSLGHQVATTSTNPEKVKTLNEKFKTFYFSLLDNLPEELLTADIVLYTIPPIKFDYIEHFFNQYSSDKKIIFISSISVYGKNQGDVTETSPFHPATQNALTLRQSEEYLKKKFKNVSIVRLGGLFDDLRNPVHALAGKTGLKSGKELLHLVHRDDCIDVMGKIVQLDLIGEDFNLVNDLRVEKRIYYTELAQKLGLIPPQFEAVEISSPTRINNEKAKKMLGQKFKD